MKTWLNHSWVQDIAAFLIHSYFRLCFSTIRWSYENKAEADALLKGEGPVVLAFWHERLYFGHHVWSLARPGPMCILASNSRGGDLSVKVNTRFGNVSVRGSSAKKSDPNKQKGGAQGFRDLLRWLKDDGVVIMTPDGSRGPRRVMTEGTLKLSQLSGAPIVIFGAGTHRYLQLRSWDKMRLPVPFTKAVVTYRVLPPVPRDIDESGMESLRQKVEADLSDLTDRADDLTGAPRCR